MASIQRSVINYFRQYSAKEWHFLSSSRFQRQFYSTSQDPSKSHQLSFFQRSFYSTAPENSNDGQAEPPQSKKVSQEEPKKINKEYEELIAENKELRDKYYRALAETENVRRRSSEQMDNLKKFSIQGFSKDLLEVADVLTLALEAFEKDKSGDSLDESAKNLREGVHMTKAALLKVFAKHGVVPVSPEGELFDPNLHDAIFEVPHDQTQHKPGHIAQVLKIGYHLHDRPIRPSKVAVVKSKE